MNGDAALVIGIGNAERADDGVGLEVARRVAGLAEVELAAGDPAQLISLWQGRARVILVDAVSTGHPPGTVLVWDMLADVVLKPAVHSSHALGPLEAIEIGRALSLLPDQLFLVGIEGCDYGYSPRLSTEVRRAVGPAVSAVQTIIEFART